MNEIETNFPYINNRQSLLYYYFMKLIQYSKKKINFNFDFDRYIKHPKEPFELHWRTIYKFCIMLVFILIFSFLLTYHESYCEKNTIIVLPNLGIVNGGQSKTYSSQTNFYYFLGIPYAESPSQHLRFQPPVEKQPWKYLLDGTRYGLSCPTHEQLLTLNQTNQQKSLYHKMTQQQLKRQQNYEEDLEDCLNLNIYTRKIENQSPVMVYIHGGGFTNGTASDYPPQYLLESDIVLVVVQYRIGVLGFLSTSSEEIPGNVAVLDVILALKWIQKYIHNFGGDPKQVTIFGQSAGAAITSLLTISPIVPVNLFQRAIIQSGSIYAPWAVNKEPLQMATDICMKVGCSKCIQVTDINECLINMPTIELITALATNEPSQNQTATTSTSLSIALTLNDYYGVLPQLPEDLPFNNKYTIMTGATKHDGSLLIASMYDKLGHNFPHFAHTNLNQLIKLTISTCRRTDDHGLFNQLLTKLLFPSNNNTYQKSLLIPSLIDLASILLFKSPVLHYAQLISQQNECPSYLYTFDYEGEFTRFGYEHGNEQYPFNGGIHHSDDNLYIFPYPVKLKNPNDIQMSKMMVQLWTSFAITGKPTCDLLNGIEILPMQNATGPYFRINKEITIGDNYLDEFVAAISDPNNQKLIRRKIINLS